MTEPSQYFKGRTVQEQMNEVIGYVDTRAEEVAAAKADDVLEPAEQAKDDAIAAKEAAENARDTTLAALPQIQQDITDLKAEDVALDGKLDNVELRITTAEGNIVTIQGRVTAVENKNTQQDSAIAALQAADAENVKLTGANAIGNYAMLLTGNQTISGNKDFTGLIKTIGNSWAKTDLQNNSVKRSEPDTLDHSFDIRLLDMDGNNVGLIQYICSANSRYFRLGIYNLSGNVTWTTLASVTL